MEDLREPFELEGVWWLKNEKNIQLGGVVKYVPGVLIELKLIGYFKNADLYSENEKYTLHGISNRVGYVTLFDCNLSLSGNLQEVITSKFQSSQMFIGAHYEYVDELVFKSVSCRFSNFEEWVDVNSWQINDEDKNKLQLIYENPGSIEVYSEKNFTIWFDFGKENYTINYYYQKQFCLNQYTALRIEYRQPVKLDDYLKLIEKIKRLLTIFLGKPVFTKSILLFNEQNKKDDQRYNPYYSNLIYVHLQSFLPRKLNILEKSDMLFAFPYIKDNIQTVFSNWLEKYKLLEPVFDLYFSTVYNSQFVTRDYFINVIQAIESFHRRIYGGINFPMDEKDKLNHEKLIKGIIDTAPTEYIDWLNNRLIYRNEWSLSKRVKYLFEKYNKLFSSTINNFDRFASKIARTRNCFIHYNPGCEKEIFKGAELYEAGKKLNVLMIACILELLEFDNDKIHDVFSKSSKYSGYLFTYKFEL